MVTPTEQKIRDKTITAKQWADMVKSGDWIMCCSGPAADSTACLDALGERLGDGPGQVKEVELTGATAFVVPRIMQKWDPQLKYHMYHAHMFIPMERAWNDKANLNLDRVTSWGWSFFTGESLARWSRKEKSDCAFDWAIFPSAIPEQGMINFTYGVGHGFLYSRCAKKIVVEIRDDYAWCEGGRYMTMPVDEVDYFVEVDTSNPFYRFPQMDERAIVPSEAEKRIANNILTVMGDGDCLQVGFGALPTAIVMGIRDAGLKHLGAASESSGEWMFTLMEAGSLDNSRKNIDRGRCTYAYGAPFDLKRCFDFMNHNTFFCGCDTFYTNNFSNISRNDYMIGINNFIAMDLFGQVCSDQYAGRPIGGTGGQFQFTVGCALSKGGRGILVATSRDKNGHSRFVPTFPGGTSVEVPSQWVTWVATENGIVNMAGKTKYERVNDIINILAHPDDREWLEKESYSLNLVPKTWKLSPNRRYPDYWKDLRDYKHLYGSELTGHEAQGYRISGK